MLFCAEAVLEMVQNVLFIWFHKENTILPVSNCALLSGCRFGLQFGVILCIYIWSLCLQKTCIQSI